MLSIIPDEIVINILEELPVKTIVRCTALNKSWYSTIKTPGLLKPHLKYSSMSLSIQLISATEDDEETCLILSQDSIVCESFFFGFRANHIWPDVSKLCSCNGVICLSDTSDLDDIDDIFLFNPSIRKLRCITPAPLDLDDADGIEKPEKCQICALGCGYDEFNDDYKVVVSSLCSTDDTWSRTSKYIEMAEVYSSKTNSCKLLEIRNYGILRENSVSINNVAYWLRRRQNADETHCIVSFDFSAEVFHKFDVPDKIKKCFYFLSIHLLTYNRALAIMEVGEHFEDGAEVSIWTLKEDGEGSWNQEFTRVIPELFDGPFQFTESGKLIYWRYGDHLTTWDPKSGKVVDLDQFSDSDCKIIVEDYIESLILL